PRVWDVPPIFPSADSLSALSPTGSQQDAESPPTSAGYQPATQQSPTLRYVGASVLLADLAEAVIGKRVNVQGALESVSPTTLAQVRQRVASLPRDADFTRWLEWFFADRSTRTISPYSPVTVPQYTDSLLQETNAVTWHEALLLCPTNALA